MADVPDPRLEGGLWCHEVLEALEAYLSGTLPAQRRAAIEAHLAACDQCARFGGTYAELVRALHQDLRRAPALDAPRADRLAQHLARALEEP